MSLTNENTVTPRKKLIVFVFIASFLTFDLLFELICFLNSYEKNCNTLNIVQHPGYPTKLFFNEIYDF
jgi:hypothetical protein